jgi:hypothetical protein
MCTAVHIEWTIQGTPMNELQAYLHGLLGGMDKTARFTIVPIEGREYRVDDLWKIADDMPAETMDPAQLKRFLSKRVWGRRKYTPSSVLSTPKDEMSDDQLYDLGLIDKANLKYPIIVYMHKGRIVGIPDGFHRLTRAVRDGRKIKVVRLDRSHIEGKHMPPGDTPVPRGAGVLPERSIKEHR